MKRNWLIAIAVLVVVLVVAQVAQAMSSASYRLDWFAPLTASGGASASANYGMKISIGQTVSQSSASSNYKAQMGYWAGVYDPYLMQLPLVLK